LHFWDIHQNVTIVGNVSDSTSVQSPEEVPGNAAWNASILTFACKGNTATMRLTDEILTMKAKLCQSFFLHHLSLTIDAVQLGIDIIHSCLWLCTFGFHSTSNRVITAGYHFSMKLMPLIILLELSKLVSWYV
jgi:hypothetical protein